MSSPPRRNGTDMIFTYNRYVQQSIIRFTPQTRWAASLQPLPPHLPAAPRLYPPPSHTPRPGAPHDIFSCRDMPERRAGPSRQRSTVATPRPPERCPPPLPARPASPRAPRAPSRSYRGPALPPALSRGRAATSAGRAAPSGGSAQAPGPGTPKSRRGNRGVSAGRG